MLEVLPADQRERFGAGLDGLERVVSTREAAARDRGYGEGYLAAMDDVADHAAVAAGSEETPEAVRARVAARVRASPAFRSAIGGINTLVEEGGGRGEAIAPAERLIGAVASVMGDRIVVESLVRVDGAVGSAVEVRRASARGEEQSVARGKVERAEGSRLTVALDRESIGSRPRASDRVYLRTR